MRIIETIVEGKADGNLPLTDEIHKCPLTKLARAGGIWVLLVLSQMLASADLAWREIDPSGGHDKQTVRIGQVMLTVQTREDPKARFNEDSLVMTVVGKGNDKMQKWFSSTYGVAAVAIHGDLLFLKYGVGRGTSVREEYVKILKLNHGLQELADVHTSFYVNRDQKKAEPDLTEYGIKVQTNHAYTTIRFLTKDRTPGIPSEKIITFKNDD